MHKVIPSISACATCSPTPHLLPAHHVYHLKCRVLTYICLSELCALMHIHVDIQTETVGWMERLYGWATAHIVPPKFGDLTILLQKIRHKFYSNTTKLDPAMNQVALYMVTTYLNRIRRARGASRWLGVDKAIWSSLGRYMSYPIKALKSLPQHQYVSFIDSKECSRQLFTNLVHWGPASCRCTKWFCRFRSEASSEKLFEISQSENLSEISSFVLSGGPWGHHFLFRFSIETTLQETSWFLARIDTDHYGFNSYLCSNARSCVVIHPH